VKLIPLNRREFGSWAGPGSRDPGHVLQRVTRRRRKEEVGSLERKTGVDKTQHALAKPSTPLAPLPFHLTSPQLPPHASSTTPRTLSHRGDSSDRQVFNAIVHSFYTMLTSLTRNALVMTYKVRFYKKLAYGAISVMSYLFYVHLMDTDYVAECLTVFHGNGAAIDRIRTDFTSGVGQYVLSLMLLSSFYFSLFLCLLFRSVCCGVFVLLLFLFYIA